MKRRVGFQREGGSCNPFDILSWFIEPMPAVFTEQDLLTLLYVAIQQTIIESVSEYQLLAGHLVR